IALVVILVPLAIIVVPILTHQDKGTSQIVDSGEEWPLSATAECEDGRTRTIDVHTVDPGGTVDTSALHQGDRIVVSGSGYDTARGIYVAICKIAPNPSEKPGPCLGGVPSMQGEEQEAGSVQFAPSNWVND